VVDQADRDGAGVMGAVVARAFDAVGVVAGPLDHPGVGPVPGAAVIWVIVVTRAITSPLPSPSRSGTSYSMTRT
jgi:hypothetical protein